MKKKLMKSVITTGALWVIGVLGCGILLLLSVGSAERLPALVCYIISLIITLLITVISVYSYLNNRYTNVTIAAPKNPDINVFEESVEGSEIMASLAEPNAIQKAILKLVLEEEPLDADDEAALAEAEFPLDAGYYIVLIIAFKQSIGGNCDIDSSENIIWSDEQYMLAVQCLESWLPDRAHLCCAPFDDLIVSVIAVDGATLSELEQSERILMDITVSAETTATTVNAGSGSNIQITMGEPQGKASYIKYSFTTAMDIMEYVSRNDISSPVFSIFDTDRFNKNMHHRLLDLDTKFYHLLMNKNPGKALEIVIDLIDLEANNGAYSLSVLKQFTREKFNTLMRIVGYASHTPHGMPDDLWKSAMQMINAAQSVDMLKESIGKLADEFSENYMVNTDTEKFKVQIQAEYIRENYRNPNLNAEMVARHFDLSPPSLSKSFKHELGVGVLEYIHLIRIERAKEYLLSDKKISDIAILCGYHTRRAFDTVFKRYTGITPREFRQSIENK